MCLQFGIRLNARSIELRVKQFEAVPFVTGEILNPDMTCVNGI